MSKKSKIWQQYSKKDLSGWCVYEKYLQGKSDQNVCKIDTQVYTDQANCNLSVRNSTFLKNKCIFLFGVGMVYFLTCGKN
jgi:hypothetical protein